MATVFLGKLKTDPTNERTHPDSWQHLQMAPGIVLLATPCHPWSL